MDQFIAEHLPFWPSLTDRQRELLLERTRLRTLTAERVLHMAVGECTGVKLIRSGQVRIFVTSPEGEEVNLYRLVEGDVCVLSVASTEGEMRFEACVQAERTSEVYMIPTDVYQKLEKENPAVRTFTQNVLTQRLWGVMDTIRKVTFSSISKRLAGVLIDHMKLNHSNIIPITHESLAKDVGTAREVISRTLKQFQDSGLVSLERGKIIVLDDERLRAI